jgi:hypothetical protein
MFSGLKRHEAAAVSCGEQPRPDSDLFYRAISWNHDRFMSADGGDVVLFRSSDDSPMERRRGAQISDTACLVRRDVFLRYRHRGNYAEDLDLGLRLTADGYRLVYLSSPRIVHSHNRPAYYHLRRSYVEHLALFEMLPGFPAVPGSLESVTRDVLASAAALDRLVAGPLQGLAVPCSPSAVRDAVTAGLRATGAAEPARDYLDPRTRAFVDRLPPPAGEGEAVAAGSLTESLDGIAGLLCAYLADASRALDAALLDDFKSALYKGWAQHCGVRLASVYWRGPDEVRASMRPIHDELTREV